MAAFARARSWLADIFAHNHAENLRIGRAAQRNALGIAGQEDYPYPGAVNGSGNPTTNTTINQSGWLKGALLGASLLGGGAVAGLGVVNAVKPAATTPAPETQSPAPAPAPGPTQPAFDEITEQEGPVGIWTEVPAKRRHLSKQQDGSYK